MIDYQFTSAKNFNEGVQNLYQILSYLRSPEGCPWDREQKPDDIAKALLDETYEYIDALNDDNTHGCSEEIGDILLNAFMIIRMHEENNDFSPVEVLNLVCEKLVRRHPHVFAMETAANSSEVLDIWNDIKEKVEGKKRDSEIFFSRMPKSLPQLEEAWEIQKHMRKVGFDWPDVEGVLDKVEEEFAELREALAHIEENKQHVEEELGDMLFAIVNLARYVKISPSVALHKANRKIMKRFNEVATRSSERGIELTQANVDTMNRIWNEIKSERR
jgi:MazG family protein